MPCSSHPSGSIIGCGPCIQVDQNGGWISHRPQQPFQAPQQGLGISNEPTYTPQEPLSLDSLGGPGAGKAILAGAAAGYVMRRTLGPAPWWAFPGFLLLLLAAIIFGNWAGNERAEVTKKYEACLAQVDVQFPLADDGTYTPESQAAQDACYNKYYGG